MDNVVKAIPVRDAHGDELTLYEYEQAVRSFARIGLNRAVAATRLALDTGEEAERIDDDTFVLIATRETLTRVR